MLMKNDNLYPGSETAYDQVIQHLRLLHIFDVPKGRHNEILTRYLAEKVDVVRGMTDDNLQYILSNLVDFNAFIEKEAKSNTSRLNSERQAILEPKRMNEAIAAISALGYEVKVMDETQINFQYKEHTIRFFPYSGWASGKTIRDGRGIANLLSQLSANET